MPINSETPINKHRAQFQNAPDKKDSKLPFAFFISGAAPLFSPRRSLSRMDINEEDDDNFNENKTKNKNGNINYLKDKQESFENPCSNLGKNLKETNLINKKIAFTKTVIHTKTPAVSSKIKSQTEIKQIHKLTPMTKKQKSHSKFSENKINKLPSNISKKLLLCDEFQGDNKILGSKIRDKEVIKNDRHDNTEENAIKKKSINELNNEILHPKIEFEDIEFIKKEQIGHKFDELPPNVDTNFNKVSFGLNKTDEKNDMKKESILTKFYEKKNKEILNFKIDLENKENIQNEELDCKSLKSNQNIDKNFNEILETNQTSRDKNDKLNKSNELNSFENQSSNILNLSFLELNSSSKCNFPNKLPFKFNPISTDMTRTSGSWIDSTKKPKTIKFFEETPEKEKKVQKCLNDKSNKHTFEKLNDSLMLAKKNIHKSTPACIKSNISLNNSDKNISENVSCINTKNLNIITEELNENQFLSPNVSGVVKINESNYSTKDLIEMKDFNCTPKQLNKNKSTNDLYNDNFNLNEMIKRYSDCKSNHHPEILKNAQQETKSKSNFIKHQEIKEVKHQEVKSLKDIDFKEPFTNNAVRKDLNDIRNEYNPLKKLENKQFSFKDLHSLSYGRIIQINSFHYEIRGELGKGGSSIVFEAFNVEKRIIVAIKCINLNAPPSIAQGYKNEISLLHKLQKSDYVVKMFDWQEQNEILYVVMEKGETDLAKLIDNYTKIPLHVIIFYWMEMLTAVKHIHQFGIIHSDLKPNNFLLVMGRLKLIDFGISSTVQDDFTSIIKTEQVGTINYISPEALVPTAGSPSKYKISYRSDVWSLGCILYKLIYGRTPFSHLLNKYVIMETIINPEHVIDYPKTNFPSELIEVLKKCLRFDPRKRPSVDELLNMNYVIVSS